MKKSMMPFAFLLAVPALGAGCQSVECGEGAVQQGDQCVPSQLPVVCGAGTELVDGKCEALAVTPIEGGWGFCGGKYSDTVIVDADGNCKPAGGNAGANAARVTGITMTLPAMFKDDANVLIASDLAAGNILTYVGVHHIHREGMDEMGNPVTDNPYRVWTGVDGNATDDKFALDPTGPLAEATATVTGATLASATADFPIQIFGGNLVLVDAVISEAVVDESGAFSQLTSFRLKGTITPANAGNVTYNDQPLSSAIPDAKDGSGNWTFDALITAEPESVSDRP